MLTSSDEEKNYQFLGILLALCIPKNSDLKTGPLFSEEVYAALASIPEEEKDLDEWYIHHHIYLQEFLVEKTLSLVNLDKKEDDLPVLKEDDLKDLAWVIDPLDGPINGLPSFLEKSTRVQLRTSLLEGAKADPRLKAILCIGRAMRSYLENGEALKHSLANEQENLKDLSNLKDRIEGLFSPEALKKHLVWESDTNKYDLEKTKKFLHHWIDKVAAEEEDIDNEVKETKLQSFIRAVTGCNALSAEKLKIILDDADARSFPRANTCWFSLTISSNYPNQEHFNEQLEIFLKQALADSGFQVA